MLTRNGKMKKSSGDKTWNFTLPAYRSKTGMVTCPLAGVCATGCYAQQGTYIWSNISQAYERNLAFTLQSDFVDKMTAEIQAKRGPLKIRIHDSGDFYSLEYLKKWLAIARQNPTVKFYAYTKAVAMVKWAKSQGLMSHNFTVIYSYGGKSDHLINPQIDRHSMVFNNVRELLAQNYVDGTEDDNIAASHESNKIGLVYHGHKSKNWGTK